MKVRRCCFCISVETGVLILGTLVCFSLLGEMDHFNPIRLIITLACMAYFFIMVFKDSVMNREFFFYCYVVHLISQLVFGVWQAYEIVEEKDFVEKTCKDIQKKD